MSPTKANAHNMAREKLQLDLKMMLLLGMEFKGSVVVRSFALDSHKDFTLRLC